MPLTAVVEKLQDIPTEYLDEIAKYIDSLKIKISQKNNDKVEIAKSLFGILPADITLEEAQAEKRNSI